MLTAQSVTEGEVFEVTALQFYCILSKVALMLDIWLEFIMFCYELYQLHQLEKQSINVIVRYSEPERRKMYASKYSCRILF